MLGLYGARAMNPILRVYAGLKRLTKFGSSKRYWERRYRSKEIGSGDGSYGTLARYKAEFLNAFLADHDVERVVELGCGDGNQLELIDYPEYLGLDVAPTAVEQCQQRFADDPSREFRVYDPSESDVERVDADLWLSLDVIYHLVEDEVFERHLELLFGPTPRWVIVYSSDEDRKQRKRHVKHRAFSHIVEKRFPAYRLVSRHDNPHPDLTSAEFFVFTNG